MLDIVAWAQGGINYDSIRSYPLAEIVQLQLQMRKINNEIKRQSEKR
jgi:hypothetical protein